MKVLTLAKKFPVYHPRAGEPTGFREAFLNGTKIHTIRINAKGYWKDGDIVSVRQWSGRPYASKQEVIKDGVRIGVVPVAFFNFSVHADMPRNDGLSPDDFDSWFFSKSSDSAYGGSILHFTDFRYS